MVLCLPCTANRCTCSMFVIKYDSVSTRGRHAPAEGPHLPLNPSFTWAVRPSQPHPAPPRHLLISPTGAHRQTQAHNPDTCPLITHKLLPSLCSRGLMGNLLKVLACTELEHGPIVFLDFEREIIRFFFFI